MKVAVLGLGYVGTVTAACLANNGQVVSGVDPDRARVDLIRDGRSPVVEPGLDELISSAVASGRLSAATHPDGAIEDAAVVLICVGTPSSPDGNTDLTHLLGSVEELGRLLVETGPQAPAFRSIVIRSTVPPGTVEGTVIPMLEAELGRPLGQGFSVAMCPEFMREGSAIADFYDAPFTVVGTADARVVTAVEELFGFLGHPTRVVPIGTAEALKYACNAFHAIKVSFTNELSRLFRELGVDGRAVMELFCEDDRLNLSSSYLRPGFAFGGSCLPKDLRLLLYLARVHGVELPMLLGTVASNELTIRDVVDRAVLSGGRKVAILGLSFKTGTDDLRESPSVELAAALLEKGFEVRIYDPIVQPSRLVGANLRYVDAKLPHLQSFMVDTPESVIDGADIAVVSSSSDAVVRALRRNPPRVIIDLNGRLGEEVESIPGYDGVGWRANVSGRPGP